MSRLPSRATFLVLASFAAGCSFLLDFPDQGEGGSAPATGGNGGSGAGDTGGAGGGGSAPVPFAELLVWRGIADLETDNETVATTGLLFNETLEKLYAFGTTTDGLDGFELPVGGSAQIYLLGFPEETAPQLLMNGIACDGFGSAATRRIGQWYNDDEIFFTGSLGTIPDMENSWAFAAGSVSGCDSKTEIPITPTINTAPTDVPLTGLYSTGEITWGPLSDCNGVVFEWKYRDPVTAAIGATSGAVLGEENDDTSFFILMQEDVLMKEPVVKVFDTIPSELAAPGEPKASWVGGIEVDGLKRGWFTGGSCDIIAGCEEPQMFLGVYDLLEEEPEFLVKDPGVPSAGTSVAFVDGMIVVGGRYEGSLTVVSEVMPEVDWAVPLLVAVESTTRAVLWTYPTDEIAAGLDASRWRTVSDTAVVGNRETGFLFVSGCSVPPTATTLDCTTFEPGKTGFLMKIALATGEVVWTSEVALEDAENDVFLPTALTAGDERVWVAVSYRGEMNAWGLDLDSGPSVDSAILRIIP